MRVVCVSACVFVGAGRGEPEQSIDADFCLVKIDTSSIKSVKNNAQEKIFPPEEHVKGLLVLVACTHSRSRLAHVTERRGKLMSEEAPPSHPPPLLPEGVSIGNSHGVRDARPVSFFVFPDVLKRRYPTHPLSLTLFPNTHAHTPHTHARKTPNRFPSFRLTSTTTWRSPATTRD